MNVLIIDDNEMTRTLLRAILSGNGHKILGEASSGKQGLEQALRLKPDVICLDILMPDGSGIDILKQMTQKLPETAVLMVTGKRDPETARECMASGAKGVIVKPFNAATVLKTLGEAMLQPSMQNHLASKREGGRRREKIISFGVSSLGIRARLLAGFGGIMLLTLLACAVGGWGLHASRMATEHMVGQTFVKERLISEWSHETKLNGSRAMAIAKNADPSEQESIAPKINETSGHISQIQKQLDAMPKDSAEIAFEDDIAQKRKDYIAARDAVFSEKKYGHEGEAKSLVDTRLEPMLAAYVAAIQNLSDFQVKAIASDTDDVANQFSKSQIALGVLTCLALLVGTGLALAISHSITGPLQEAIAISRAVSKGDLTTTGITVSGSDELSELLWGLKHMNENLGVLVGQVLSGADAIAVASGRIATGSLNLSSRTEQQASSLEETASTMEELTSTVRQNADNARQANELAESASAVAVKGGAVVSQVVDTMGSINASSKKISDIIGVIDGIAFQTNILALNAAVEAARAGEQGRGFAVVATEVRNLAQRSAAAAKEIKTLIGDSVERVGVGAKLVDQAGATMGEIVASIRKVTDIVGEITVAGREQSAGIEQIGNAINHLDKMTQQNAILVENSLGATRNMEGQARGLVNVVQVFKLDYAQETSTSTALTLQNGGGESRGKAKEAVALVKRAIDFRKTCTSRDAFLHALTDRRNKFFDRDMYVFALDKGGRYLAFGGNPAKVGSRVQDIPGVDGDGLLRAIIAQCNQGPGWVDYEILNAATNTVQSKMSYVELLDGVYLGCGVYTSLT